MHATQFRYWAGKQHDCEGKLTLNNHAFEIGLQKGKDGKYNLLWDDYGGGNGMVDVVGKNCGRLRDEYNGQVTIKDLSKRGMRVKRVLSKDGAVQVVGQL